MELWNTTDVARYLGVKPGTVSAYRHRGQMPAPVQTIGARTHLWDAESIRLWRPDGKSRVDADLPERADPNEWLVYHERDLYKSDWVRLSLVDVEPPVGQRFEHHVVTMKPAAMVAVLSSDLDRVGLIWRHRFAPGMWNWELPGGLVEDDESPAQAVRREAKEEVGLKLRELRHLVTFEPAVGMVRSPHHVYVAKAGASSGRAELNEGDGLEWIELASVERRIKQGEIQNSGTLVALLHLLAFGL